MAKNKINNKINIFFTKLKKHKDVSQMFCILSFVLYINIFHCNDFSKILVSCILLSFFYNSIFNDWYLAIGFGIISVVVIELLQMKKLNEHLENKETEKDEKDGDTDKDEDKKDEDEDKSENNMENMKNKNSNKDGAIHPDKEVEGASINSMVLADVQALTSDDNKEDFLNVKLSDKPEHLQIQSIENIMKSIERMQGTVEKLSPTIQKGMKVMEQINSLGMS
jgi:hypothetical protein